MGTREYYRRRGLSWGIYPRIKYSWAGLELDWAWFAFEGKLALLYNLVGPGTTMGWWTKYLMNRVGYSPAEELVVI